MTGNEVIIDHEKRVKVIRGKDKLSNHIELKKDNWSVGSKKKLKASIAHKIRKLYVCILDTLDGERADGNLSQESFKRLRAQILNISNDQIRHMEMELNSRYNVEAVNYHITLPVVGPGSHTEMLNEGC